MFSNNYFYTASQHDVNYSASMQKKEIFFFFLEKCNKYNIYDILFLLFIREYY